uniref:Cytochrome P450 n=1 Tax=Salix viminalis TaxID=40686 RepID=A0A6N2NFT0_SALVM
MISALLPFGLGPKICVGTNFAHNEIKIANSMIHQRQRDLQMGSLKLQTITCMAAFLPFGLGPRRCVGSVTETKIALAMILKHCRFTPTSVNSPAHLLTMSPQHGVQIKLEAFPSISFGKAQIPQGFHQRLADLKLDSN